MKISDLKKYEWEKGEEWQEKWYNTELCFLTYSLKYNPLLNFFAKSGLNSIALNTLWIYEKKSSDNWDNDRNKAAKKGKSFLKKLNSESEKYLQEAELIIKSLNNQEKIDKNVFLEIKKGLLLLWCVFLTDLGEFLSPVLDHLLTDRGLTSDEIEKTKIYYLNFNNEFDYQKEEKDLRDLSNSFKEVFERKLVFENLPQKLKLLLEIHAKKYQYLTGFDLDTKFDNAQKFYEKLKNITGNKSNHLKRSLPLLIKSKLKKEDLEFLDSVRQHVFLDNYCADLYAKLDFFFLKYLIKYFNISFKALSWYSFSELETLTLKGIKVKKEELDKRKRFRVMVQINGKIKTFYGKKDFQMISSIVNIDNQIKIDTISGLIASKGFVKGTVKIIKGTKDINKIELGEILVATTTHPDLMIAIRKCSAIVTDHGGITSHAAIISREFSIPCIVGTKIATQVLKDGDLVEVDANKGIVKIIR